MLALVEQMRPLVERHPYASAIEEDVLAIWYQSHGNERLREKKSASDGRVQQQKGDKASSVRLAAQLYHRFCEEEPNADASVIYGRICEKLGVEERTLQTYLSEARTQGLIPKRHVRKAK